MHTTKEIGDKWELIAIKYLQKNDYKIIDTNFKYGKFWEIDIVCEKEGMICFIEVKYRNNLYFWEPEEAITKSKLHKSKRTVDYYVMKNHLNFERIRFDVITILKGKGSYQLKHYKNLEI
jgi:putative endonuclease